MSKFIVIAGNNDQAMRWIKDDITNKGNNGSWRSISDYTIIHRPEQLRGLRNPKGTFIGTWKERHDLIDILHTLLANTDPSNPSHNTIRDLLTERMK